LEYPPVLEPESKSFHKKTSSWRSNGNLISVHKKSNSKLQMSKENIRDFKFQPLNKSEVPKLTSDNSNIYEKEVDQESVTAMLKCLSKCMDKIEKEFETINKVHIQNSNTLAKKLLKLRNLLASSDYSDDNKKNKSWLYKWRIKFKELLTK
jgi:hypothetical protein